MLDGHPIFWILAAAVLAPLLAEIPIGFKVPIIVLEVALGIVIGPHVLHLVQFDGFVETMFTIAMAVTLFIAGMELDFGEIKGRPLFLAVGGWAASLILSATFAGLLHAVPHVHAPLLMVALAMCTTGLGVLIPIFRDGGQLGTAFGRFVLAIGTLGELGPIVAMSLLLSGHYSSWQEVGFLVTFLAIVGVVIGIGMSARPPLVMGILGRHMNNTTQLPVRISMLMLAAFLWLAGEFRFRGHLRGLRGRDDPGASHTR
jgi:Kef-type K+ transport system membrane component KefB